MLDKTTKVACEIYSWVKGKTKGKEFLSNYKFLQNMHLIGHLGLANFLEKKLMNSRIQKGIKIQLRKSPMPFLTTNVFFIF